MVGLPQMRRMDKQTTRMLRRLSMGCYKVTVRWLAISMASSSGSSSNNDVGCHLSHHDCWHRCHAIQSMRRRTKGSHGGMDGAMACAWMELQRVDGGETKGWRGRAARSTYVDCRGDGGGGQAGVTVGVLKYLVNRRGNSQQ